MMNEEIERKKTFCREFMLANKRRHKLTLEDLIESKHPIYIMNIEGTNITTMSSIVNRKKVILKYVGLNTLRAYSKKELNKIFKDMHLFVSYITELKLYREIRDEHIKLLKALESVDERFS